MQENEAKVFFKFPNENVDRSFLSFLFFLVALLQRLISTYFLDATIICLNFFFFFFLLVVAVYSKKKTFFRPTESVKNSSQENGFFFGACCCCCCRCKMLMPASLSSYCLSLSPSPSLVWTLKLALTHAITHTLLLFPTVTISVGKFVAL